MRGDTSTGPIRGADGVRNVFTDHPEDPAAIVDNGFVEGFVRVWRKAVPPPQPLDPEPREATLATGLVLRFDTPAHAHAVDEHFRRQNARDGYQFFAVPAGLTGGYGTYVKLGETYPTYHYSVAWMRGDLLFDVSVVYDRPQPSPDQVIAFAVAQDAAA
jgi:hypothetical protein